MALEDDNKVMLIGFIIVLIVGINIIIFFGNIGSLGGNIMTGAATFSGCTNVADGIQCGTTTYASAEAGCPNSYTETCTNDCELSRLYTKDNRVCPTACENICIPTELVKKL
jgi:hypothetical protein